jgi:hypothetical protein
MSERTCARGAKRQGGLRRSCRRRLRRSLGRLAERPFAPQPARLVPLLAARALSCPRSLWQAGPWTAPDFSWRSGRRESQQRGVPDVFAPGRYRLGAQHAAERWTGVSIAGYAEPSIGHRVSSGTGAEQTAYRVTLNSPVRPTAVATSAWPLNAPRHISPHGLVLTPPREAGRCAAVVPAFSTSSAAYGAAWIPRAHQGTQVSQPGGDLRPARSRGHVAPLTRPAFPSCPWAGTRLTRHAVAADRACSRSGLCVPTAHPSSL